MSSLETKNCPTSACSCDLTVSHCQNSIAHEMNIKLMTRRESTVRPPPVINQNLLIHKDEDRPFSTELDANEQFWFEKSLIDFFYNLLTCTGPMKLDDLRFKDYTVNMSEMSHERIHSFGGLGSYLSSDRRFQVSQNIVSVIPEWQLSPTEVPSWTSNYHLGKNDGEFTVRPPAVINQNLLKHKDEDRPFSTEIDAIEQFWFEKSLIDFFYNLLTCTGPMRLDDLRFKDYTVNMSEMSHERIHSFGGLGSYLSSDRRFQVSHNIVSVIPEWQLVPTEVPSWTSNYHLGKNDGEFTVRPPAVINQNLLKHKDEDRPLSTEIDAIEQFWFEKSLIDFFYNLLTCTGPMRLDDLRFKDYTVDMSEMSHERIHSFGGLGSYLSSDRRFQVSQNIVSVIPEWQLAPTEVPSWTSNYHLGKNDGESTVRPPSVINRNLLIHKDEDRSLFTELDANEQFWFEKNLIDFFYNLLTCTGPMRLDDLRFKDYTVDMSEMSHERIHSFGGLGSYLSSDRRFQVSQNIVSVIPEWQLVPTEVPSNEGLEKPLLLDNQFCLNHSAKESIPQPVDQASAPASHVPLWSKKTGTSGHISFMLNAGHRHMFGENSSSDGSDEMSLSSANSAINSGYPRQSVSDIETSAASGLSSSSLTSDQDNASTTSRDSFAYMMSPNKVNGSNFDNMAAAMDACFLNRNYVQESDITSQNRADTDGQEQGIQNDFQSTLHLAPFQGLKNSRILSYLTTVDKYKLETETQLQLSFEHSSVQQKSTGILIPPTEPWMNQDSNLSMSNWDVLKDPFGERFWKPTLLESSTYENSLLFNIPEQPESGLNMFQTIPSTEIDSFNAPHSEPTNDPWFSGKISMSRNFSSPIPDETNERECSFENINDWVGMHNLSTSSRSSQSTFTEYTLQEGTSQHDTTTGLKNTGLNCLSAVNLNQLGSSGSSLCEASGTTGRS